MKTAGNAKPARGQDLTGKAEDGAKENSSLTSPDCTTFHNHLSSLIDQASRLMSEAEARRDFLAWSGHFMIWISLHSAKYGLPWLGTVARG